MSSRSTIVLAVFVAGFGCDVGDADGGIERMHVDEGVPPGQPCDLVARPSVYFVPMRLFDDFSLVVDVDAVWYEHKGVTYEATCLPDRSGGCTAWVAGWEREGEIRVWTEYCDEVVESVAEVPIDETGCHVVTQHVLQHVSTRGCFATPTEGEEPPI